MIEGARTGWPIVSMSYGDRRRCSDMPGTAKFSDMIDIGSPQGVGR